MDTTFRLRVRLSTQLRPSTFFRISCSQRRGEEMENDVRWRKLQCADFLTSESEEEQVRGAKMQPLTVVGGIGQRLVSAANLRIESSAGAKSGCGFSLSRPREGRLLPSVRDANGGILAWIWRVDRGLVKFF